MPIKGGGIIKYLIDRQFVYLIAHTFYKKIKEPFYSNSLYILLSSLVSQGIGLVFWYMAANFYSKEVVGYTTAMISLASMVFLLSRLGFDQSLIRFFPNGDRNEIMSMSVVITLFASFFIGLISIIADKAWSLNLIFNTYTIILFFILVMMQSMFGILNNIFIASRNSKLGLFQNLFIGSRILILIPFASFGMVGILSSWVIAMIFSVGFSIFMIYKLKMHFSRPSIKFVKSSLNYSVGNYISSIFTSIPSLFLPILILSVLGPSITASYYVAFSLYSISSVVIVACNTSLLVEGSYGEALRSIVKRTIFITFLLLVPVVLGIFLFGGTLLGFLGSDYRDEGVGILRLLLISSIVVVPYSTYLTILRIQQDVKKMLILGLINFLLIMITSYTFIWIYGIDGIGYAWIITGAISSIIAIIFEKYPWPIQKKSIDVKKRKEDIS